MSGYHFFVEMNGGMWHRTEADSKAVPLGCTCGILTSDSRVLKMRGHDDDSWKWCPESQLGACFPESMRKGNDPTQRQSIPKILDGIPPSLGAAIVTEVHNALNDPRHPTRIAYERARSAFPDGGDDARRAFHVFLQEEKAKRDGAADRSGPKAPLVDEKTGVPMCSHTACPKYAKYLGRCTEDNVDDPQVCIPAVRDMVIELDARKDAADPAFDEIVKLCGLAKTWEYPGQVVRDVEDALKKRDERIAELERLGMTIDEIVAERNRFRDDAREAAAKLDANKKAGWDGWEEQYQAMRACIVYARDRRGSSFDFDEWNKMVEYALRAGFPPPHALEDAQTKEAQAWAAVTNIRKERDELRRKVATMETLAADTHAATIANNQAMKRTIDDLRARLDHARDSFGPEDYTLAINELRAQHTRMDTAFRATARAVCKGPLMHGSFVAIDYEQWEDGMRKEIATVDELRDGIVNHHTFVLAANEYLRTQQRVALAIRDDARRASQKAIDEKRAVEAAGAELTALVAKLMPEEQKRVELAERAWMPFSDRDIARGAPSVKESPGQCPWIMPDADPDEGYWHCKLEDGHTEPHVTEFGRGRNERWYMPCEDNAHTFVGACCRDCGYPVPGAITGGPTLGGEDMSPVASVRRAQIDAVVMGDPQPHVPTWARPGLTAEQVRDAIIAEVGMMADARTPAMQEAYDAALARDGKKDSPDGPRSTTSCSCSPKYVELAPGVHSKYCALAGLPLSDGHGRWRCTNADCAMTYRHAVENCLKCGAAMTEVASG